MRIASLEFFVVGALVVGSLQSVLSGDTAAWRPADGPLMTRWAKDVAPDRVHSEYPRPQLVRPQWANLNGLWNYTIQSKDQPKPADWDGKILVPFCVESALSGVMKSVGPNNRLWYQRQFHVPEWAKNQRLLLHFDAVDWHAQVWVNGRSIGEHKGGYDPFYFDITDALTKKETQELVVSVWDPADKSYQPRGKQVLEPHGIWYTSVTGIWSTVWLEAVPAVHIESLMIEPDVDHSQLRVTVQVPGSQSSHRVVVDASLASSWMGQGEGKPGQPIVVPIPNPKLWSPDSPTLYDLSVTLSDARQAASPQQPLDRVTSYFGMRKIAVQKDADGINRLFLNNKPLFQFGPLDQGWWPDGLYTAPTDEALRHDIEITKRLGFNMCRKHVKVEPDRWYYWCDKLGLMVWQDMPSGDKFIGRDREDLVRTPESAATYRREYKAMIDAHHNHPCIVTWVPFNEGWGQFETKQILAWTKQYDPTRLVDSPSGWADRGTGDMHDMHRYPGPAMPEPEPDRAVVLGEFGGLGLPLKGHLWWDKRNWGYRSYASLDELEANYETLIRKLPPLIGLGLAAAVYTQTTDVEGEVNGLMTYDRAVVKRDVSRVAALHHKLYLPPPVLIRTTILPTSEQTAQTWNYTTQEPPDGWERPGFEDSGWKVGAGGFGRKDTPGTIVRTPWHTENVWLRRTFQWHGDILHALHLRVHHDEDTEIYLNGHNIATAPGYTTGYEEIECAEVAREALKRGVNVIAVHCRQTRGGQYIDVGLIDVEEKEAPKADKSLE